MLYLISSHHLSSIHLVHSLVWTHLLLLLFVFLILLETGITADEASYDQDYLNGGKGQPRVRLHFSIQLLIHWLIFKVLPMPSELGVTTGLHHSKNDKEVDAACSDERTIKATASLEKTHYSIYIN